MLHLTNEKEIISYVMGQAAKSNIEKRQVGCVITDEHGTLVSTGFNDLHEHAEQRALSNLNISALCDDYILWVSHPPCPECAMKIAARGIKTVRVVEAFKKFDGDKTRYDLIPPSAFKGVAEVLTFGARKYAPNNWRQVDDLGRYEAAMMRHFEAYRMGEKNDEETGLPHLAHAMTNLTFLLELTRDSDK